MHGYILYDEATRRYFGECELEGGTHAWRFARSEVRPTSFAAVRKQNTLSRKNGNDVPMTVIKVYVGDEDER